GNVFAAAGLGNSGYHLVTILVQEALREVLGTHVEQRGSFVSPEVLRFDFSHFQKLTPEEIRRVEHLANAKVRAAIARDERRNVPIAEAVEMGAMALFGEKYGEEVRVIRYGSSVELCGGTHVENTGNIGMIRIVSESSIAAGIRRIEAITGEAVEKTLDNLSDTLREVSALLGNASDVRQAVQRSIAENAKLQEQIEEYFNQRVKTMAGDLINSAELVHGNIKVVTLRGIHAPEVAKGIAFAVRQLSPDNTVFLAATSDIAGKPLLTVMITDDLVKSVGFNASTIVREAAKAIKGGGGGQPGFAQAGGKSSEGLSSALETMLMSIKD
ncbi:MAG: alanine--tRNA ligase, partial [Paramuribaculum sp.]|nr:alanine--tRNA ligase [Paramuribaculum sp.]